MINGTCGMEATVWREQAFCAKMEQKDTSQINVTTTVQAIHMRSVSAEPQYSASHTPMWT